MLRRGQTLPDNVDTLLRTVPLLDSEEGRMIVRKICEKRGFSEDNFLDLVAAEVKHIGRDRRRGMTEDFEEIFDRMDDNVD